MICFGKKSLDVLVQLSHDYMCEFLAGLVEPQTSCSVHKSAQFIQFLLWQATQIQLHNIYHMINKITRDLHSTAETIFYFTTYFTSIQYIISWADSEIQFIYWVWGFKVSNSSISEGCVIYCHASIDRDVAQAQQRCTL